MLFAATLLTALLVPPPADASDGASVESAVAALYACVTHPAGGTPDFARMKALLVPGGLFVPPRREGEDLRVLDVDGFESAVARGAARRREKGEAPVGFAEREAARHTDCFGNICQVFSTYESRHTASDPKPYERGINAIQLVHGKDGWRIASVVWDVEAPDRPIPPERLPH